MGMHPVVWIGSVTAFLLIVAYAVIYATLFLAKRRQRRFTRPLRRFGNQRRVSAGMRCRPISQIVPNSAILVLDSALRQTKA
jgi:uncharacterized protein (DUF58 family)